MYTIPSMNTNPPPIVSQSCDKEYVIEHKSDLNGFSKFQFRIDELKGSTLLDHNPLMCNFKNDVLLFEATSNFSFLIKHLVDHSGDHRDEIKKRLSFPPDPEVTGKENLIYMIP